MPTVKSASTEGLTVSESTRLGPGKKARGGCYHVAILRSKMALFCCCVPGDLRLQTEDGIEVWPLRAFLEAVAQEKLWP